MRSSRTELRWYETAEFVVLGAVAACCTLCALATLHWRVVLLAAVAWTVCLAAVCRRLYREKPGRK